MDCLFSKPTWVLEKYVAHNASISKEDTNLPQPRDLLVYPFITAAFIFVLKYFVLIPLVFTPIAIKFNIKSSKNLPPPPNSVLESFFLEHGSSPKICLESLAQSLGKTQREVQRWLRLRIMSERASKMKKFVDCACQLTYYVIATCLGIYTVYDMPWLFDFSELWTNFPNQPISNKVWWYYMVASGFYWEETLVHSMRPKKSDSNMILVHHICALFLLASTWVTNVLRIGPISVLILECNDIPLLLAKLFRYVNKTKWVDICFGIFILSWIITRLVIYPFGIMRECFKKSAVETNSFFHFYHVMNFLLMLVMVMNLIWTYNIAMAIVKKFKSGEVSDVRSSEEEGSSLEENDGKKKEN